MSIEEQNQECTGGVCEVRFRPGQLARKSFHKLQAIASEIIGKVKDSLGPDEAQKEGDAAGEKTNEVNRQQADTVKENLLSDGSEAMQISRNSSAILNNYIKNSFEQFDEFEESEYKVKPVIVRARPPANLREAPRYSNPWRYDARH